MLAAAERELAALLADPAISPAVKNTRLIPAAQEKITAARTVPSGDLGLVRCFRFDSGHLARDSSIPGTGR